MKRFLVRAAAEWLASKFFKLISGGANGGSSSGSSGGGIFDLLKGIFGGSGGSSGVGGTPNFNPSATGGSGGFLNTIRGLFSGGGSSGLPSSISTSGTLNTNFSGGTSAFSTGGKGGGIGLAGGLAIGGMAAGIIGNLVGGAAGKFISNIGNGVAMGASLGSIIPGIGTAVGAVIGGGIGLLQSILGGDPKRKADKKENLPALNKGFTDAFAALRALGADTNAFYNDPEGTIARAIELRGQIASGFGVKFESKKYQKQSQDLIRQKLVEADAIIAELNKTKDRAVSAREVDTRLQSSFATGAYMSPEFLAQYSDFKRRNGMLSGAFTGKDTLPSMLARGEMVLNPTQIRQVIANAGSDPFKNSNIPGYAGGVYVSPSAPAPSFSPSPLSAPNGQKQPIIIYVNNTGMVETDIKQVLKDSLKDSDVQVEVVKTYEKGKTRTTRTR